MDLRSQTSLLASVVCLAITAEVLLRPRKLRVHWLFALFAATMGAWYATTFLVRFVAQSGLAERVNLVLAVFLPLSAVQFFRAFLGTESLRSVQLNWVALGLAAAMTAAVFTPLHGSFVLGALVLTYVFVVLSGALWLLYRAGQRARSRVDGARLTYLALVGTLATVFTIAEYLPYFGVEIPPVGTVLMLVFLYVISQSILRYRVLDLYELAGRLTVLTAMSFLLAGILWVLVAFDPGNFYLTSVAAALVLLLIFDPVRAWVEQRISELFFRERVELERMVTDVRRQLANALSLDEIVRTVIGPFEGSRRLTHGAIYFASLDGRAYERAGSVGPEPPRRVEILSIRALLDRVAEGEPAVLENLERELAERRELGDDREAHVVEEVIATLQLLHASVCVPIGGPTAIYGLLTVRDERLRDAYAPEEVQLLKSLGAQAAIAVENSRLFERFKERDRLATLGEMAAGLAHEIRNPLGAIKASAQFLAEPNDGAMTSPPSREFLDIIVEEVDRLNRVVSSFLDYARPGSATPAEPHDVNETVTKTLRLLSPDLGPGIVIEEELEETLPRVRIEPERLRQVLFNLARNAAQAMEGRGKLRVRTVSSEAHPGEGARRVVELHVMDSGPGIPEGIQRSLFVPFVTTKERGTGLGLAISQRLVHAAGGSISAKSSPEAGATFVVRLPAVDESPEAATEVPEARAPSTPPLTSNAAE